MQYYDASKHIKLVYEKGEVGWAVDLGEGLARIDNVPGGAALRYGDIVEVEHKEGRLWAGRVVVREYTHMTGFNYSPETQEVYSVLARAIRDAGAIPEGMVPGVCKVNHKEDFALEDAVAGVLGGAEGVRVFGVKVDDAPLRSDCACGVCTCGEKPN